MTTIAGPASGIFFAGDDIELTFTVTVDGEPVDITGAIARFSLARDATAPPVLVTADVGIILGDPTNGIYQVSVDGTDTTGLDGTYLYQSSVQDGNGNVSTVLHGWFTFLPSIVE